MAHSEILGLNSVKDTSLFKYLSSNFRSGPDSIVAKHLCEILPAISESACSRMRKMATLHPEYTLHDDTHLLRVTELMAKVMQDSISQLNPIEIGILILTAHLHDQGMVLSENELIEIRESDEFKLFRQNWEVANPNLTAIRAEASRTDITVSERKLLTAKEAELENAIQTDYIRQTHGKRSADYIRETYENDTSLIIATVNLAHTVATVSESHVLSASKLTPKNGLQHDALIGNYSVNLRYLAIILRLADILDFDRERTPEKMFRSINFTNDISIAEWEKHRGVKGWIISKNLIRFDMEFEHPEYERCARQFLDWIDHELKEAHQVVNSFPTSIAEKYKLTIPFSVDRSKIVPRNNKYIYYDLEFALSRDEIVNLLMTENLYGSSSLAIRELIQNSLDATRHRKAIYRTNEADFLNGKISLKHSIDPNGKHLIKCTDLGVGMSRDTITKYLTAVGRSYYRSTEFEQERIGFRSKRLITHILISHQHHARVW